MSDQIAYVSGTSGNDRFNAEEHVEVLRGRDGIDVFEADGFTSYGDTYYGGQKRDILRVDYDRDFQLPDFFEAGFLFDGGKGRDVAFLNSKSANQTTESINLDLELDETFSIELGKTRLVNVENVTWSAYNTVLDIFVKLRPSEELTRSTFTDLGFFSRDENGQPMAGSTATIDFSAFSKFALFTSGGSFGILNWDSGRNLGNLTVVAERVEVIGTQADDHFGSLSSFGSSVAGRINTYFGQKGDDTFNLGGEGLAKVGGNKFFGQAGNDSFKSIGFTGKKQVDVNLYSGGLGSDTFEVSSGREKAVFDGGKGSDTITLGNFLKGGLARINLLKQEFNGGFAKNMEFKNIENFDLFVGSKFKGSAKGDSVNVFEPKHVGSDLDTEIYGYGGNDTFVIGPAWGGFGDLSDNVFVDGGKGIDTISINHSAYGFGTAVIDLEDGRNNTRNAANVVIQNVENIRGLSYDEDLRGDSKTNKLWGEGGDDKLNGREGNDRLDGGSDNDILTGGTGNDRFVFRKGYDVDSVVDFGDGLDLLLLDKALLGGRTTGQQVVDAFGSIVSGDVKLDFGGGDILYLEGVSSLDGLADSLVFV